MMTFLIVLVSLIIERFFHWTHLRNWYWFSSYQRWLSLRLGQWPAYLSLIICILPLLIITGAINFILSGWFYDIFKLIFGIAILMYCLGPSNLWVQVYSCINAIHTVDPQNAIQCAQNAFKIVVPENSQAFHQTLTRTIFIKAYRRVFAVAFWFVILGPVGAVLYRTLTLNTKESQLGTAEVAKQGLRILDWIPVRIFTFLFALGGHFTEVFVIWKKSFKQGLNANEKLLSDCGIAAIDGVKNNMLSEEGSAEKETVDLLDRVFVISLVILAMSALLIY